MLIKNVQNDDVTGDVIMSLNKNSLCSKNAFRMLVKISKLMRSLMPNKVQRSVMSLQKFIYTPRTCELSQK